MDSVKTIPSTLLDSDPPPPLQGIDIHPECRELLARMLVVDPSKRLSMAEIKQHKWYQTMLPDEVASSYKTPGCAI